MGSISARSQPSALANAALTRSVPAAKPYARAVSTTSAPRGTTTSPGSTTMRGRVSENISPSHSRCAGRRQSCGAYCTDHSSNAAAAKIAPSGSANHRAGATLAGGCAAAIASASWASSASSAGLGWRRASSCQVARRPSNAGMRRSARRAAWRVPMRRRRAMSNITTTTAYSTTRAPTIQPVAGTKWAVAMAKTTPSTATNKVPTATIRNRDSQRSRRRQQST